MFTYVIFFSLPLSHSCITLYFKLSDTRTKTQRMAFCMCVKGALARFFFFFMRDAILFYSDATDVREFMGFYLKTTQCTLYLLQYALLQRFRFESDKPLEKRREKT